MTTEVGFLAGARADFDSAFDWYSARSESASKRFVEEVQASLDRIALDPERFAHLDDVFRQARMKRFPYRIIFQHEGNRITVIAIAHHSRRPEYWRRTAE
jgi:plasmid stabilization system protein ParE